MKLGTYRNPAGAVLRVTNYWTGTHRVKSLGGIYVAEAPDLFFGTMTYLVTEESMRDAGYELIKSEVSDV